MKRSQVMTWNSRMNDWMIESKPGEPSCSMVPGYELFICNAEARQHIVLARDKRYRACIAKQVPDDVPWRHTLEITKLDLETSWCTDRIYRAWIEIDGERYCEIYTAFGKFLSQMKAPFYLWFEEI